MTISCGVPGRERCFEEYKNSQLWLFMSIHKNYLFSTARVRISADTLVPISRALNFTTLFLGQDGSGKTTMMRSASIF